MVDEENRYRLLVDAITDYAIFMLDPGGFVASWNPGAARFKGYTRDEILGQHFSRFYTPEDQATGLPARALKTAAKEGRFEHEGWRVRKDGTRFWAYVIIDPIRDEAGDLIGFAKVTRDLTERHEAQQALENARETLAQAQKMDALGQLTGGIAHDFNNLLMAILASNELLRKRLPNDPDLLRLLDNASLAAQRGSALTRRMLAFARRQGLQTGPVDLRAMVQGMTDILRQSLGSSATASIETRFPLSLPEVRADGNQLETAVLNLVLNARDAMPDGGTITIGAHEGPPPPELGRQPGRYVCLSVADTGEGMDEATLARAAEPFFTTKGVGKGTGLGLSMVHGLAEQFGGRLLIRSRLNAGTTVELWLAAADDTPHVQQQKPAPSRPQTAGSAGGLVVLAVDDDALVLMNTVEMLKDLGHEVLSASSGKEAVDLLEVHSRVDLLITDQAMPRMTGLQLADAARKLRPELPVILATGYGELPTGVSAAIIKLEKPFLQGQLADAIGEVRAAYHSAP